MPKQSTNYHEAEQFELSLVIETPDTYKAVHIKHRRERVPPPEIVLEINVLTPEQFAFKF